MTRTNGKRSRAGKSRPLDNRATLQHPKPLTDAERKQKRDKAWATCQTLAQEPRILDRMVEDLRGTGLVGEDRAAQLAYLAVTSRFLDRPVCAVVKGPPSAGKNFLTDQVLSLFPPCAFHRVTAMSQRALAYGTEPLVHRTLVVEEAAGLCSGVGAYLVRSLISEGRLHYETVESSQDGLKPLVIEREGPTGLLVTTTKIGLEPELETRLFSIPISDTPDQTRSVLSALAAQHSGRASGEKVDVARWHALQTWIELGEHRVVIPYAERLAAVIQPVAVRLRRDFGALLRLIEAHALLYQAQRERDAEGRIIASVEDYEVVHGLVADLFAMGAGVGVSETTRETVEAVRALKDQHPCGVPLGAVADHLGIDKSAASRRVQVAVEAGYLINEEEHKGRPAKLKVGAPQPNDVEVLPKPEALAAAECCSVAVSGEGVTSAPAEGVTACV